MDLAELNKGDKTDLHLALYERELELLDSLCARFETSRSAVIGALLREFAELDLAGKVPAPGPSGKRGRRGR